MSPTYTKYHSFKFSSPTLLRKLICYTLLLFSLYPTALHSQTNYFNLLGDKASIDIPFRYTGGFIVIAASINGKDNINLILDTGAENLILFNKEKSDEIGLLIDSEIKVKGSDIQGEAVAYISRKNFVSLKGTAPLARDIIILKDNSLDLTHLVGIPIEGLLGARTFWGLVMKIDYSKQLLTLTRKSKFIPPHYIDPKYQEIDIEIKNHKPYIYNKVSSAPGNEVAIKTLIDSGSAIGFMILLNTSEKLHLPPKFITGKLGKGLGGDIEGYIGKLHALSLSDQHRFNDIVSYYQNLSDYDNAQYYNHRNAVLGNPILSKFDLVIDYVDAKLYLKPNRFYKRKLKFDKSGMTVYAVGPKLNQYVIQNIYENSPAAEVELLPNDIIKQIGFRPSFLLDLDIISRIMQRKEGKKVKIVVERDGKKLVKRLILRDYLK